MKKVVFFLLVAITLGSVMLSCGSISKSSKSKCPAYGEHQQYQRESVY